jgi:hypothetical protein
MRTQVGVHAGEQSFSNGCLIGNSSSNGRHNGWRFAVKSGHFGEGGSGHVVVTATRKDNAKAGKVMIWHRTRSFSTPAVPITISVNGLNGHGEEGGSLPNGETHSGSSQNESQGNGGQSGMTPSGSQVVAGVQFAGSSPTTGAQAPAAPSGTSQSPGESAVLGVNASGGGGSNGEAGGGAAATAPVSAVASRQSASGRLPFTGLSLVYVLLLAAGCLTIGLALRRATRSES